MAQRGPSGTAAKPSDKLAQTEREGRTPDRRAGRLGFVGKAERRLEGASRGGHPRGKPCGENNLGTGSRPLYPLPQGPAVGAVLHAKSPQCIDGAQKGHFASAFPLSY